MTQTHSFRFGKKLLKIWIENVLSQVADYGDENHYVKFPSNGQYHK